MQITCPNNRNRMLVYLFNNNRINKLSEKNKKNRIKYILNDIEQTTNIFDPIEIDDDKDDIIAETQFECFLLGKQIKEENEEENNFYSDEERNLIESLNRIKNKRIELAKDKKSNIELTKRDFMILDPDNPKDISKAKKEFNLNNYYSRYGRTPLHEAIMMKDIPTIKKFLKKKKYINKTDNNGFTPFEMAKFRRMKNIVKIFKEYNVN